MTRLITDVKKCALLATAAASMGLVIPAFAGDHYRGHDDRVHVDFGFSFGRDRFCEPARVEKYWVEPTYRTTCERVWVEPEYRFVCDRIWHEPVYRDDCTRVWVPDQYEYRDCTRWEYGRRVIMRERVLVSPGHFEEPHAQVLVREGFWEDVQRRELVCDGHWTTVERRELVCAGHWETRIPGQPYDGAVAHVGFDRGDRYGH